MENEYYGMPTTPTSDYLAHYGIKGMKWGVRKAIERGDQRALGRQYRKAQKKLAKLERQASNGKKYAKRAAGLGAGAAALGGLAAAGTEGVGIGLQKIGNAGRSALRGAGNAVTRLSGGKYAHVGNVLKTAGNKTNAGLVGAGKAVRGWGASTSMGQGMNSAIRKFENANGGNPVLTGINNTLRKTGHGQLSAQGDKLAKVSNNTYARLGAGAAAAGLAGAAGYNAYRAATTKRAAKKAAQFRSEMNKAFAGTQYANGGAPRKKRRR